jgi:Flp pilus assembly protein TadD
VSERTRVYGIVGVIALAAATAVVVLARATGGDTASGSPHQTTRARKGVPPLALDFGVRTDPESVALRRASEAYRTGKRRHAARVFDRYSSLEARIGSALAAWPDGAVDRLRRLVTEHPQSGAARLHYGFVLLWAGHDNQAVRAWRQTERIDPDSSYAVEAGNALHPNFARDLPGFVPTFAPPPALTRLAPAKQVAALERRARTGGAHDRILFGVVLQRLGQPVSAEREFAAAARLAPNDPEARVAAAVGRFSKDDPSAAFSRLGPLTRVFPRAPTVRFHLGLLLFWIGQVQAGKAELHRLQAEAPRSLLAREGNSLLRRLNGVGTH